jgi:RHS repeat-associated protein
MLHLRLPAPPDLRLDPDLRQLRHGAHRGRSRRPRPVLDRLDLRPRRQPPDPERSHQHRGRQPHTLGSTTGAQVGTYKYDLAGNTKARPGPAGDQALTWDPEGHLDTLTDSSGAYSYLYDADGNRLISRDPNGKTLYLPGAEIRYTTATNSSATTRYYTFGGDTIASRTTAGLTFLSTDHQGTAQVAINATTQALTVRRQTPFGGARGFSPPSWPNTRGFVGGTTDATGLIHEGAREYDPGTGRFLSVDPLFDHSDPQSWHGYAYSDNNPVTSSDPSGLEHDAEGGSSEGQAHPPADPDPYKTHITDSKGRTRDVIVDEKGHKHVLRYRGEGMDADERAMLKLLNDEARAAGYYSDGSNGGTGYQWVAQDDVFGKRDGSYTTSDYIRVTWVKGRMVAGGLLYTDLYTPTTTSMKQIRSEVEDKLGLGDKAPQAQTVIVNSKQPGVAPQAKAALGDLGDRVRAMAPDWGDGPYDSGEFPAKGIGGGGMAAFALLDYLPVLQALIDGARNHWDWNRTLTDLCAAMCVPGMRPQDADPCYKHPAYCGPA